ncbi:MAG: hypothetical protein ICV76_03255 [Nitrospiraceae bacterium]|jgi:hypothetical protein|nr:hypothetical protein [Nitrospiraceae bacterium]
MTDAKYHTTEAGPLEGREFRPVNPAELYEAVEQAFDYRGDVTLELTTGTKIEGYLFNRDATGPQPYLQVFPKDETDTRVIPYAELAAIAFTGKDTASGKSWEAWVAKKESQRRVEAEQAAAEARARGHL